MNHPYELLADLADGTLDEGDLAGVQAHLDACASCRDDVAHATAGREAARSLPQVSTPKDLHQRIVTSAGGRGHGTPGWYRWAGVAAAAAVVVAIAIALPNVGGGDRGAGGREDAAASVSAGAQEAGTFSAEDIAMSVENTNYDEEALQQLASASRSAALSSGQEAAPTGTIADPAAAVRCVTRAAQGKAIGRPIRLIQARFEGRDAYIAVYLEGPGADQQPDLTAVWVAARDDCSFLSLAFAQR
jgi:anti-sigma factor RsiW